MIPAKIDVERAIDLKYSNIPTSLYKYKNLMIMEVFIRFRE